MEKLQEYELVMKPMLGRKRILRINRTRYEFYSSDKNFTIQQEGIRFELPAQKGKAYCYCLEYINDHFIFTAITDRPFKINGVNSFKSYVEVGDTLEFSYSQLSLKKRKSSEILEPYSFMKKILKDSSGDFFIQVPLGIDYESLFKYKKNKGELERINMSAFKNEELILKRFLFGYSNNIGLVEKLHGGCLVIENISEVGKELQQQIYELIESRQMYNDQGQRRYVDINFIFIEKLSLRKNLQLNRIIPELYYCLKNSVNIKIDGLCEDQSRIERLCYKFAEDNNLKVSTRLINYYKILPWYGNDKELLGCLKLKLDRLKGRSLDVDKRDENLLHFAGEASNIFDECFLSFNDMKNRYFNHVYLKTNKSMSLTAKILDVAPATVRKVINYPARIE